MAKNSINYYQYIQSEKWRDKAIAAKLLAGNRCQVCNKHAKEVQLDTHHRTYERLGNELPEDLTVLCHDCHQLYESSKKLPKPPRHSINTAPPPVLTPQHTPIDEKYTLVDAQSDILADEITLLDPATHFLPRLGSLFLLLGYIGSGYVGLVIEWQLGFPNFSYYLNPFVHLQAFLMLVSSTKFWQFTSIVLLGIIVNKLGIYIVKYASPNNGAIKWYLKWGMSAILKVPMLLLLLLFGLNTLWTLIVSMLSAATVEYTFMQFPIIAPALRFLLAILLLPVLHLIWNNKRQNGWAKFFITVFASVLILLAYVVLEFWVIEIHCFNGFLSSSECQQYEVIFRLIGWSS